MLSALGLPNAVIVRIELSLEDGGEDMIGSATTPRSRSRQSVRIGGSSGRLPGSLARIVVGKRTFAVVPAPIETQPERDVTTDSIEHTRFELCGQTFVVIEEPETRSGHRNCTNNVAELLTERELQVALLVAQGDQVKCIAHKLGITEWTVKEYLRRIFAKLHVRSQAAMVYLCSELLQRLARQGHLVTFVSTAAVEWTLAC